MTALAVATAQRSRLIRASLQAALAAAVLAIVLLAALASGLLGQAPAHTIAPMPVPGADVEETIVSNGMPVPGSTVDETVVEPATEPVSQ